MVDTDEDTEILSIAGEDADLGLPFTGDDVQHGAVVAMPAGAIVSVDDQASIASLYIPVLHEYLSGHKGNMA